MSSNKLYVGNLPFDSSEVQISEAFAHHGSVQSVSVITDRETGRPRGFAFVEMDTDEEAEAAVQALDGSDFGGRNLKVNVARPRESRGHDRGERGHGESGRGGSW